MPCDSSNKYNTSIYTVSILGWEVSRVNLTQLNLQLNIYSYEKKIRRVRRVCEE